MWLVMKAKRNNFFTNAIRLMTRKKLLINYSTIASGDKGDQEMRHRSCKHIDNVDPAYLDPYWEPCQDLVYGSKSSEYEASFSSLELFVQEHVIAEHKNTLITNMTRNKIPKAMQRYIIGVTPHLSQKSETSSKNYYFLETLFQPQTWLSPRLYNKYWIWRHQSAIIWGLYKCICLGLKGSCLR